MSPTVSPSKLCISAAAFTFLPFCTIQHYCTVTSHSRSQCVALHHVLCALHDKARPNWGCLALRCSSSAGLVTAAQRGSARRISKRISADKPRFLVTIHDHGSVGTHGQEQFLLCKQFASFGVRLPRETTCCIFVLNHLVQLVLHFKTKAGSYRLGIDCVMITFLHLALSKLD